MKYLIDTQILIWFNLDSDKLKRHIYDILIDTSNQIYVSQISLMEIVIKQATGKLSDLTWGTETIVNQLQKDSIVFLNIEEKHISACKNTPFYEHHRDPFDRFLLATALSENMTIISSDGNFDLYTSVISLIKA
jgi:PIN domain nuclease of toxin-antitoxin system